MAEMEQGHHDRRPDPDPTRLTTEQLYREIAAAKDLLNIRIDSVSAMTDARIRAIEIRFLERYAASWAIVLAVIGAAGIVAVVLMVALP